MLTPSEYDHLCDQLITLYTELDRVIIEDIVRRMLKEGRVTDMTKWQAERLQESGLLYEDVIAEIAARTNASQAQVHALFEDAGVQSIRNDNVYYQAAGLGGIIRMSDTALQVLNAGYAKCAGNLQNLTLTTANTAQAAYYNACNTAYMQVESGALDYNTAIRHAIRDAAADGTEVLYPSGHRDKLDVAVRRAVLTGVGQTCRTLSEINAMDMGCDLMETTAHSGARPSHAAWQGRIVSLSGRRGYLSKSDIGYGTGDGFGGWNCRHDWHPFFEGISQRAYKDARLKELNEPHIEIDGEKYTDYEVSQMQRAMERDIRKLKREAAAINAGIESAGSEALEKGLREDFAAVSVKLKAREKELKEFLQQTGNLPDTSRVWVNGFGRSVSQRAVHANKKALTSGMKSGIINMKRAKSRSRKGIKVISDEHFNNLTIEARKNGALILRGGEEVERHLDNMQADAAIIGDVILFREHVCVSEVLEETHHFMQNQQGMNNDKGEPLRTILNEIDAKQYLLDNAQKFGVPRSETELTMEQLKYYKDKLAELTGGGTV